MEEEKKTLTNEDISKEVLNSNLSDEAKIKIITLLNQPNVSYPIYSNGFHYRGEYPKELDPYRVTCGDPSYTTNAKTTSAVSYEEEGMISRRSIVN